MEDSALSFFDQMYDTVPYSYRLVPKVYKEDTTPAPVARKSKSKPMSMVELKERAQSKIENIQQQNRDKSMAKIKQLTEQHKKTPKVSKADKSMFEDLEKGESDDETPKKMFKNKGKVDESKLANKRKQKEAKKSIKINKTKGIIDL
jgi:hypothetical protein